MIKLTCGYVAALGAIAVLAGADVPSAEKASKFERDRNTILAMAGDFHVTFRFDETLRFSEEAEQSKRLLSRGFETVKIVADEGDYISLQHLLVVENDEGERRVVKHWRQDWRYEPASMLVYRGKQNWERVAVSRSNRDGAWTQTVYQVDDSPRYAGVGQWKYVGDYAYWEARETWRPLPRRERKERDDYDVLVGMNRHSLTPEGWAHEQDNYKLALREDGPRVRARETGENTYDRAADYDFSVADEYWEKTGAFWQAVRDEWAAVIEENKALHIADTVDGKKMYKRVMPIADDYGEGVVDLAEAKKAFREVVADYLATAHD